VVRAREGWDDVAAAAFGALVVDLLALLPAGDGGDVLMGDVAAACLPASGDGKPRARPRQTA
jgi:hypothetical protein